ncbi:MAG: hypothetical protein AB8G26_14810, partial [Ilumatobacter sp.]
MSSDAQRVGLDQALAATTAARAPARLLRREIAERVRAPSWLVGVRCAGLIALAGLAWSDTDNAGPLSLLLIGAALRPPFLAGLGGRVRTALVVFLIHDVAIALIAVLLVPAYFWLAVVALAA